MKELSIQPPPEWTSRNPLEDGCLFTISQIDRPVTPLLHSLSLGWSDLSAILMKEGSGPQTVYYSSFRIAGTVLSRILAKTTNVEQEVTSALEDSALNGIRRLVSLNDVEVIFSKTIGIYEPWLDQHKFLRGNPPVDWDGKYSGKMWEAIIRADKLQSIPLKNRSLQSRSRLVVQAAEQRNYQAIESLLDLGFDPNGYVNPWKIWQLQLTALDMVAWTANLKTDPDLVGENQLGHNQKISIQMVDGMISDLLKSHGGFRGWELTWEFHLAILVLELVPKMLFLAFVNGIMLFLNYYLGKAILFTAFYAYHDPDNPNSAVIENPLWAVLYFFTIISQKAIAALLGIFWFMRIWEIWSSDLTKPAMLFAAFYFFELVFIASFRKLYAFLAVVADPLIFVATQILIGALTIDNDIIHSHTPRTRYLVSRFHGCQNKREVLSFLRLASTQIPSKITRSGMKIITIWQEWSKSRFSEGPIRLPTEITNNNNDR